LYVPKTAKNLFSDLAAHDKNETSKFTSRPESCLLVVNGQQVLSGSRQIGSGLYKIALRVIIPELPIEMNVVTNDNVLQL
jgi:hypothetical protein